MSFLEFEPGTKVQIYMLSYLVVIMILKRLENRLHTDEKIE